MASVVPRTKDDLLGVGRIEEAADGLSRRLVRVGRASAQRMHTAMDVGVLFDVVVHERIEHRLRLLRRRGVVEIDERLAVDALPQDREIPPNGCHIQRFSMCGYDRCHTFTGAL